MPNISSLPANPELSQYSPYGRNYGNGLLNLLAFSAFGFNYAPKPEGAQGMYDAYYNRERSRQFMNIQQDAFANNMLFKMGGFNPESNMMKFAGRAFGSPDGMVARMLSPLIGGNPMAAQMQLYAGLSGGSVMGAFGRLGDVSKRETDEMMRVVEKNFYRTTPIDQVEEQMKKDFRQELIKNPEYAKQMGIGVPVNSDGTVNEEETQRLVERGEQREKDAQELATLQQEFEINEQQITRPYDERITQNVSSKVEALFSDIGISPEEADPLEDPVDFIRSPKTNLRDSSTGGINLEVARKSLDRVSERLKTPEQYNEQLADRMAEQMGIPFKKKFNEREIVTEGGVPVKIDDKEVPAELHTQEQRDQINAARQAAAAQNKEPAPAIYGEGIKPASEELYSDIVKPEQNPEARRRLNDQVNEGYRLTNVIEENERNRPYDAARAQSMATELEDTVVSAGLADEQTVNENKVQGRLSTEFIKSLESSSQVTTQKIEALNRDLKESESKIGTPDYNEEVSKQISNEIKDNLKRDFNITDEELTAATGTNGLVAPEFVQTQIQKREEAVQRAVGLSEQVQTMEAKRPATNEEIRAVSTQIEQQIRETGVLNDREISGGKDRDGNVTADLVNTLETTANEAIRDIGGLNSQLNNNELKAATRDYDQELSKAISDQIKEKLEKAFEMTEEELAGATNANGVVDPQFVKSKLDEQEQRVQEIKSTFNELVELQDSQTTQPTADPFDPVVEANDRRQQKIRTILKDTYGVTDEQLAKATDEKGNIKADFIDEVVAKEKDRAGVEKSGIDFEEVDGFDITKEAENLSGRLMDRTMQAEKIGSLQEEINQARKIDTAEGRERAVKLQEELNRQLKRINVTDDEIDKNTTDKEGGFLGFGGTKFVSDEFIQGKQEDLTKMTYADVEAQRLLQYRKAGGKISGINFEKTRGFNMEDFTSGFTAAADLRLIGGKGGSPAQKMDEFMQNSGGAMSAARSVFGDDLSGGQLVTKISDLMGPKAKNLTTQQGASEIEKTLRDVKATARVAGVSIDALLGIIDQAKEVARNNPRLSSISSAGHLDMTMKALSTTTAMAGVMNAEEYRRAGGTQGMLGKKIGEQQLLMGSDVGQSLMGLQQMFAGDPEKMEAFKRALKEGGFDESGVTEMQIPALLEKVLEQPEMAGMKMADLVFGMNDAELRRMGSENSEIVGATEGLMTKAASSQFFRRLETGQMQMSKDEFIGGYEEAKKKAEAEGKSLTLRDYATSVIGGKDQGAMHMFGKLEQTISEEVQRTINPEYFEKVDATRKRQAELDAELDKKLGGRNAPVITQIVDALASGDQLDVTKTEKLMRIFADEGVYDDKAEMERLQTGFTQAITASATQNAEGVAEGLSKALNKDVSEEDLETILAGGRVSGDFSSAQNEYRRLKEKKEKAGLFRGDYLTKEETTRMQAFEKMEELGIIDSSSSTDKQKAYEVFMSGEGVAGITAGAVEAEKNRKNKEQLDKVKAEVSDNLGKELMDRATNTSGGFGEKDQAVTRQLLNYYAHPDHGGFEKMMEDAESGVGAFDETSEIGKALGAGEDGGTIQQIRDRINQANEQISETEKKVSGEGASPEEDLPKQLKDLIDAFNSSKLTDNVGAIATAFSNIT